MLIKLHGIFARDYGPEYEIEAETIADAVEGLTRQLKFYEHMPIDERPVVRIAGVETEDDLYAKKEQKEIHLVPAMIGGGGGFGKILIGAALIGLAFIPGLGTIASVTISSMLMTTGIGLVLSGAMQLFMKAPEVKNSADPKASKYMSLSDNTVAIGTPIAIQYGRGPATGHVLAINIDSSEMVYGTFPATTS